MTGILPPAAAPRLAALALGLLLPALAGCDVQVSSTGAPAPPTPTVGRPGIASIPLTTEPAAGVFDAVHVNRVLGPAVAEVIVNTAQGTQLGSGFVIAHAASTSYLLTNNHVVQGARRVQVLMPDGRHFLAEVQGADPVEDIAVLRGGDATLPLAVFAESTALRVGQPVAAIGSPEGNQSSLTVGVVSAVHRQLSNISAGRGQPSESLPDVIQTDAAINPGNSGGPLADAAGHVVGVNTAGETGAQNIGFAIPSLVARRIAEDLIAGRTPGHPYVGICFLDLPDALASADYADLKGHGVVVTGIVRGGPGDRAGLTRADVVQALDTTDLSSGNTLGGVLQLHRPGDQVTFSVLRGGAARTVRVTLGDRPAPAPACG